LIQEIIVGIVLLYASLEDLRKQAVHDKVFLYPSIIVLAVGVFTEGLTYGMTMLIQGFLALIAGFILGFIGKFGGADIWTLIIVSLIFPDILLFKVLAYLLVPMLVWVKFYTFVSRKDAAPAIPGLLIGYLILLSVFGI
jgi:Flp pilus assembly protein protease CpaA